MIIAPAANYRPPYTFFRGGRAGECLSKVITKQSIGVARYSVSTCLMQSSNKTCASTAKKAETNASANICDYGNTKK